MSKTDARMEVGMEDSAESVFRLTSREQMRYMLAQCMTVSKRHSGRQGSRKKSFAQSVLCRQALAAYTLWGILHPVRRPELVGLSGGTVQDFPSGYVILRAMYETLIEGHYVLLGNDFEGGGEIALLVAELHAHRERIAMGTNLKPESEKLARTRRMASDLQREVQASDAFSALPLRIRKWVNATELKSGEWHRLQRPDLARKAGFHVSQHHGAYKFFSNHVHSNPLSLQQVGAVRSPDDAKMMTGLFPDYAVNYLGCTLSVHQKVFSQEGSEYGLSPFATELIDYWSKINGTDLRLGNPFE